MARSGLFGAIALVCVLATVVTLTLVGPAPGVDFKEETWSAFQMAMFPHIQSIASAETQQLITVNTNLQQWGYDVRNGPALWPEMFNRQHMPIGGCNGQWQSPIAVRRKALGPSMPGSIEDNVDMLGITYPVVTGWQWSHNKHEMVLSAPPGAGGVSVMGAVTFKGMKYTAKRVTIHNTAQHMINGLVPMLEFDIEHESEDGKLLNIAITYHAGASKEFEHNEKINSHLNFLGLPKGVGEVQKLLDSFSLAMLFPGHVEHAQGTAGTDRGALKLTNITYFSYIGSLTYPPCLEGVQWIVVEQSGWINNADFNYGYPPDLRGNSRGIQDLNGRTVYHSDKIAGDGFSFGNGNIRQ